MACTGNQYGGDFKQTLFLGCSVISFSASQGWGEQSTEITIELAEDPCESPSGHSKVYWNTTLQESSWTDPDPGFVGHVIDIIGLPVYFRLKDFEFTGIIQSWEKVNNTDGQRYIVKLVTPVSTLQNSKLIIGEYAGSVVPPSSFIIPPSYNPHNIINVFGYAESQGIKCPLYYQDSPGVYLPGDGGIDGAVFGTPAGGFGGSLLNNNGMPWNMIKNIINVLLNAQPILGVLDQNANKFSPNGRLTGKGDSLSTYGSPWTNGFGLLDYDDIVNSKYTVYYLLDISELPIVPDYLRFNQSEISILECITRICNDAGYDFYIELLPIINSTIAPVSGVAKLIKIRTVSRFYQPLFGQIDDFISSAQSGNILRSSSSGKEFRNEINSRFVVGGLKQTVYQAFQHPDPDNDGDPSPNPYADDMILPFFGTNPNGDMIVPYLDASGDWEFEVSTDSIESSLSFLTFSGLPITINARELRSTSSLSQWATYIDEVKTDTNFFLERMADSLGFPSFSGLYSKQIARYMSKIKFAAVRAIAQENFDILSRDFSLFNAQNAALTSPIDVGVQQDTEKLYQWVSNFARNNYGLKYAVRVPFSCVYVDPESNQILMSEQPTQDGGWTEQTGVLGLPLNSPELTFFRNDTNKIGTIVAYTGFDELDVSHLPQDSYVVYNNNLYLQGTVDPEYVYHDGIPRAIVQIPDIISSGEQPDNVVVHGVLKMANILPSGELQFEKIREAYQNVGNKGLADLLLDKAFTPDAIAFGVKSNINTYGPWVNLGPVGGIEVEKNDGLVPWEYGGYTNLNLAGNALAASAITHMQVGEMGNVTVVGSPTIPLGAELNALSVLAGNQLVENRTISSSTFNGTYAADGSAFSHNYVYFNYGFTNSGAYGPTVTNINVNIGDEITTQYQFRTYTPSFGRFARLNAERLKEVNQNRMRYVRDLRTYIRNTQNLRNSSALNLKGSISREVDKLKDPLRDIMGDRLLRFGTPHELFIGKIVDWGPDAKRTIITTSSMNELPSEFHSGNYDSKSISSFESIIRPVSIKGAGGLPKLITPLTPETGTLTGTPSGELFISQVDLIPYINPISLEPSGILNRRYATGLNREIGHDFDFVSRTNFIDNNPESGIESGVPYQGLGMQYLHQDLSGTFYDYRQDYRTFALRGPLLLHSWGYTTDGFPIPNHVDSASGIIEDGVYQSTGLSVTFMSGWSTRPDTWPVAPVDLRLNRSKGVWEAGGLATMVRGTATTSSTSSSIPFRGDTILFFQGSDSSITGDSSFITVENEMSWDVNVGALFHAIRPAGSTKYYATQLECN